MSTRKKKKSKKEKGQYSKLVVALILFVAIFFTASVLLVFAVTGNEPSTLIKYFFVMVVGELWLVAGIKKKKIKQEDDVKGLDENYENNEY